MEKQHLTYFKIENVKRFNSFAMSNLGQFNLIGVETTLRRPRCWRGFHLIFPCTVRLQPLASVTVMVYGPVRFTVNTPVVLVSV